MESVPSEISQPYTVLEGLFQSAAQNRSEKGLLAFGEREHFEQKLGLADEENYVRIPCLNDVQHIDQIPPFTLVRYRCLVQDIFETEIFDSVIEEVNELSGASRLVSTKYRECIEPSYGCQFRDLSDRQGLADRGVCYAVPLPGEAQWAQHMCQERSAGATAVKLIQQNSPATPGMKRARDTDIEMTPDVEPSKKPMQDLNSMDSGMEAVAGNACLPCNVGNVAAPGRAGGGRLPANADEFGLNLPLPWEEKRGTGASTACIVKFYDDLIDKPRICQSIEVVGILCVQPQSAVFDEKPLYEENDMLRDARNPSTSLVPRIHTIAWRQLPFFNPALPYSPDFLTDERLRIAWQRGFEAPGAVAQARATFIGYLEEHLGGDSLAAEYVAMLLVSRSFGMVDQKAIGTWTLNVTGWPSVGCAALAQALGELVPRAVHHKLTCESLNSDRWKPKKDFVLNRLVASRLQLAAGTALVLDETVMNEGNLDEAGVKSWQAIEHLVTERRLACDFMSYDVPLPLELTCLIVSKARSMFKPVDVELPLEPKGPVREEQAVPSPGLLDAARFFIALLTRSPRPIRMDQQMMERIPSEFSDARAADPTLPAELCHVWLSLARAFCLTHGCDDLTPERWEAVRALERQRLVRCGARPN